jgi:hypothetical protein
VETCNARAHEVIDYQAEIGLLRGRIAKANELISRPVSGIAYKAWVEATGDFLVRIFDETEPVHRKFYDTASTYGIYVADTSETSYTYRNVSLPRGANSRPRNKYWPFRSS